MKLKVLFIHNEYRNSAPKDIDIPKGFEIREIVPLHPAFGGDTSSSSYGGIAIILTRSSDNDSR